MYLENGIRSIINNVIELLAFVMLLMGVLISIAHNVQQMISRYRWQSASLAFVTAFVAVFPENSDRPSLLILLFTCVPILLAALIEPLLSQATFAEDTPVLKRLQWLMNWRMHAAARKEAVPAWVRSRTPRIGTVATLIIDLMLLGLAFVIAYTLVGSTQAVAGQGAAGASQIKATVLSVSLSLLLLGLLIMVSKDDIIAQVMGLLVMEQGMFLAAVKVVPNAQVAAYFVGGLFLYITITLTILVFLLPELHHKSGSVDIDQQTQLKG